MKYFFDTSVLLYMFDGDAASKRKRARALFVKHTAAGDIILSTQVLQEFYLAATKKLGRPLDAAAAAEAVASFAKLPLVQVDAALVLAAIHRSRSNQLPLWDALIVQAAIEGHATTIYSEDLQTAQAFGELQILNPFQA